MEKEIRLGPLVLDRLHCELRGPARKVRLDQKACDVLTVLIECRDRPVPRDEILARVWPGVTVVPGIVAGQVFAIREAFKNAGCTEESIRTLKAPARYQFCLAVTDEPGFPSESGDLPTGPDASQPPATLPLSRKPFWRPRPLVAGTVVLSAVAISCVTAVSVLRHETAPPLSILVKPFRNLSADRSKDYLADAITDDLTIDLGHIPFSTVLARSTAEALKDKTPNQIGQLVKVRYVLEGAIAPEDDDYHVTASLVDTQTGAQLASADFDRPHGHLSDLRQDIVSNVRSWLNFRLHDIASDRSIRESPENPGALDWYLRARSILDHEHDLKSFQQAQRMLEQARQIEPNSPQVNAELGWMLLQKASSLDDPDDQSDRLEAQQAIEKTLALSPENEKGLAAKAFLLRIRGDCAGATAIVSRVLDYYPNFIEAHVIIGMCAIARTDFDAVVTQYDSLIRLDPQSPRAVWRHLPLGTALLMLGRTREAEMHLSRCLEPEKPASDMSEAEQCAFIHIAALYADGHKAEAEQEYRAYKVRFKGRTVWRLSGYFPQSWWTLPGFHTFTESLRLAGMPQYANERDPGESATDTCGAGDFAPTPAHIPGVNTLYAADMESALVRKPQPLLIDVGKGRVKIAADQQVYQPFEVDEQPENFAVRIAKADASGGRAIIVFGDGPLGCDSYNAAKALLKAGFANVAWFRGGEEAWQAHNQKPEKAAQNL